MMKTAYRQTQLRRSLIAAIVLCAVAVLTGTAHRAGKEPSVAAASSSASPASAQPQVSLSPAAQKKVAETYGKLPLSFEANRGQTDASVKFLSRGPGYTLFLTSDEAVLKLQTVDADSARTGAPHPEHAQSASVVSMKLVGANPAPEVSAIDELPGKSNYFIGNNPKKWHTDVPNYSRVRYQQTYPGVDLVYYGNPQELEYDFVVAPGADPRVITLDVSSFTAGRDRGAPRIGSNGDLLISTQGRDVRFKRPVIYQQAGTAGTPTAKHFIPGRWVVKHGSQVGFELADFDRSKTLIIDPAMSYCTYLGGSIDNAGYNVSVDTSGNAYVTGNTTSTDFPTKNPYQAVEAGSSDVFVAKLNSTGTSLIYSTYLGGGGQDFAFWITVSAGGSAHVVGSTASADFPVTAGVLQSTCGGCATGRNAFVTVLNSKGSALTYSTYLGGSGSDQANDIQVDSSGNSYVVGWTTSANFPTTTGVLQTTFAGTSDAFVAKINSKGTALTYSTLLGVSNDTRAFGIGFDKLGDAYIAGFTSSPSLPTTPGAFQTTLKGSSNAFVSELNPTASALVYSTYLGGSGADIAWALALDSTNNAYLSGQTTSADFPTAAGSLRTTCSAACSINDTFVTKLNPTGTALVYSTYVGGSAEQESYALSVDAYGDAFITGRTKSTDFPTTPGAFSTTNRGVFDSYVTELNPTGSALNYSSYFGGSLTDTGLGITVDAVGNIYLIGRTYSTDLPVTPKAIQSKFVGNTQSYVAKFVPGDQAWPLVLNFGTQMVGVTSAPLTTTLTNSGTAALTIAGVTLSGLNASDFAVSSNTCGTSLAAGASCTVGVTLTPTTSGTRNAMLVMTDSAANTPQGVVLVGVGTVPSLTLTPSTLTYANQLVGTSSASQPATLTNVSTSTITITNIATSTQYSQTNNCPTTLAAAAFCTINVVFQPTAPGLQKGSLTVTDSISSPLTVSLTGNGTVMTFTPTSLTFAAQKKGTSSQPQVVTVKNTGATAVTITKIGITGSRVTSFSQTNTCPISPSTLAAGASCTISAVFTPQLVGVLNANLSLADTGGGSPQNVPMSGTGN